MIDTIIFDLDGTLLDTIDDLQNSVNRTLIAHHFPPRTLEEIKSFVGNGLFKLMERSLPNKTSKPLLSELFSEFKQDYHVNCMNDTHIYPGILELLKELKKDKYKLAIVSNKNNQLIQDLSKHYFNNLIDLSLGEIDSLKKKPSPDMIYYVLEKLNTKLENVIYIGDSEVDIETAQNAHITCLSVTWGFRSKEHLIEAGAKFLINHPKEIISYLKKHL